MTSSLLEFALAGLGHAGGELLRLGRRARVCSGTHSPTFAPYGGFRTADGWIVLAGAGSEDLWVRCCRVLGVEELLDDPRFVDNAARVRHRDELTAELERCSRPARARRGSRRWRAEGVPAAEVRDIGAGVRRSAARRARGRAELTHPEAGAYRLVGAPIRIDGEPLRVPVSRALARRGHPRGLDRRGVERRRRSTRSWPRGRRSRRDEIESLATEVLARTEIARGDPGSARCGGRRAPSW